MTVSNPRRYTISCQGKPTDTIAGNITCSAYDAAKAYAAEFLPGYTLIACSYRQVQESEDYDLHILWRAEVINHDTQMGEVIWVREF
jgi:hypothetical protein